MVVLVVVKEAVIHIENKEQFRNKCFSLNQILRQDRFFIIEMKILYLDFETKLFRKVGCFHQEVSFAEVVDSSLLLIKERNLMQETLQVFEVIVFLELILTVVTVVYLRYLLDFIDHLSVGIHSLQSAFHQLASLQQVMNMISKHSLPMNVSLYLEHELPASHSISDLERIIQFISLLIHKIETEHESFLLQVLVKLKLKICDMRILNFALIFDWKSQLT